MVLHSQAMPRSLPASLSSTSSEGRLPSSKSRRRGSRTLVACEACKKRKTKCSGRPAQCDACQKLETFCHFNSKLDARRKTAYKPIAVHEKKEYIFHGILKALKFNDNEDVAHLIQTLRSSATPQEIAACVKQNLLRLQDKHLIASLDVDENDILSLGLQNLFSHRGKRATFVSRDQKNYQGDITPPDPSRPRESKVRTLRRKGGDADPQNIDQEASPLLDDMDALSPVTTETSISLRLDEHTSNLDSMIMARNSTLSHFHANENNSRKREFDQSSAAIETDRKHSQFSIDSQPKQPMYPTISPHSTAHDYSRDYRHDQISPTDRFYMLFNPTLDDHLGRMAHDHMQRFKSTDKPPAGNLQQMEWPSPPWPYETGHPLLRPQMFPPDAGAANMNESPHLDYNNSLFADTLFHPEHPAHEQ